MVPALVGALARIGLSAQEGSDPSPGEMVEGDGLDPARACDTEASWACELVEGWTGNDTLAGFADWFVAKPLALLLIAVIAWIVARVARRLAARSVRRLLTSGDNARQRAARAARRPSGRPVVLAAGEPAVRLEARAETLSAVAASLTTILVWLVALLFMFRALEIDLAPVFASAGLAGVALGFGAQKVVGDFLAGTFIIIEDQYGVGDIIDLGDAIGTVEKVTLRVTRLRGLDGTVWWVPNGEIQRVANMSQEWSRVLLDVDVAYETDLDEAITVLRATAEEMSADADWMTEILETPEVWGVEAFGADGISIRMVIKTKAGVQWGVTRELRRRIKAAFDEAGIEIPFPQRTLWVRGDDGAPAPFGGGGGPERRPPPPGGAGPDGRARTDRSAAGESAGDS